MDRWFNGKRNYWRITLLCWLLLPGVSFAETYWVSPTGAASWANCDGATPLSGTAACSYSTAMTNAAAGDVVNFRAGTVSLAAITANADGQEPAMKPANSGSAGNYITFQTYEDEVVVLDNSANVGAAYTVPTFGSYYKSYHIWDGFTATAVLDVNRTAKTFVVDSGNYITVRNCNLYGSAIGCSNAASVRIEYGNYITVTNNILQTNGREQVILPIDSTNPSGVELYDSDNITITYNSIYTSMTGVYIKDNVSDLEVAYNYIYDCYVGVRYHPKGPDMVNCYIHHNAIQADQDAIGDSSQSGDLGGTSTNYQVFNNTLAAAAAGIQSDPGATANFSSDSKVFNNIVVMTNTAGKYVRWNDYEGGTPYFNYNLYYGSSSAARFEWGATDYATLAAWVAARGWDGNSTDGTSPVLVNSSGNYSSVDDFKLQDSSPTSAKTGGRGGSYAAYMGAWEWPLNGSQQIGYDSGGAPTPTPTPTPTPGTRSMGAKPGMLP